MSLWGRLQLTNSSSLLVLISYLIYLDWISHYPKADDSHGIATVAPADTMLYEESYEDFEILGDTTVQS